MESHSTLIDALGGHKFLAEMLTLRTGRKLTAATCSKWRRNGVPWRWRRPVEDMARAMGNEDLLPSDWEDITVKRSAA